MLHGRLLSALPPPPLPSYSRSRPATPAAAIGRPRRSLRLVRPYAAARPRARHCAPRDPTPHGRSPSSPASPSCLGAALAGRISARPRHPAISTPRTRPLLGNH
jgi:hypothetical protein